MLSFHIKVDNETVSNNDKGRNTDQYDRRPTINQVKKKENGVKISQKVHKTFHSLAMITTR